MRMLPFLPFFFCSCFFSSRDTDTSFGGDPPRPCSPQQPTPYLNVCHLPRFLVCSVPERYLSAKQLGFLAQNYHALRHKHRVTPSFAADTGFDTRRASLAHAGIAAAQERADKAAAATVAAVGGGGGRLAFATGELLLAKRRVVLKGEESWEKAELLDGWHPAQVVKVRNAGTKAALYTVR